MMTKKMSRKEMIEELISVFDYDRDDLRDKQGKILTSPQVFEILQAERNFANQENDSLTEVATHNISDDEMFSVMSGTSSEVIIRNERNGRSWVFSKYGQVEKMQFSDILYIYNRDIRSMKEGVIIVLDKAVNERLNLMDAYEKAKTLPEIKSILLKDKFEDFKNGLLGLSSSAQLAAFHLARDLHAEGSLDSMKAINFLENRYMTSLTGETLQDVVYRHEEQ